MHTIYKDHLLDHYKYPRNVDPIIDANISSTQENPACGDVVSMTAQIDDNGMLKTSCFTARGCVICVAGASLLSTQIKGFTLQELATYDATTMIALLGIPLGPTRLKCALLPLYALHDGIKNYTNNR